MELEIAIREVEEAEAELDEARRLYDVGALAPALEEAERINAERRGLLAALTRQGRFWLVFWSLAIAVVLIILEVSIRKGSSLVP